ncbi:unnamed protein product [Meganyctiphanes norvegica]|uniref:Cuticle protein n=1 Tax=Meganyctiphanes norvegica TaxID=48144 RepID=A0AAV2QU63_MEGNR
MITKGCMIAVLVGVAMAMPRPEERPHYGPPPPGYGHPEEEYLEPAKPYAFDYGVKDDHSGAQFGHNENSDGEAVQGSYIVALPDGRIQKVQYVAHPEHGYQAEVTYEGEATYPEVKPYIPEPYQPYQPQYGPPPPQYAPAEPQYAPAEPQYAPVEPQYAPEPPVYTEDAPAEE